MSILSLFRLLTGLLSLVILGAAVWCLATWAEGSWVAAADGELIRVRDDWRLWTGLGLTAWSALGWLIMPSLLARPGGADARRERVEGQTVHAPGGAVLNIETQGKVGGPPILFTHGWGLDSTAWGGVARRLQDRFRLSFWDLPGLGRSRIGKGRNVSLEVMAADLAAVLEVSAGRPAVLVGHSIGGMVIQTLARTHPEALRRVAGVVLLNTTHTNPLKTMIFSPLLRALQKPVLEPIERLTIWTHYLAWAWKWQSWLSGSTHLAMRFGFGRHVRRGDLSLVALLATKAPPAVEARGNLAMMNWDAGAGLAGVTLPVLVVGADLDIVTRPEASRDIAAAAPRGGLTLVKGANHLAPLEDADRCAQLIAEFALSVQPAASDGARPVQAETLRPDGRSGGFARPLL